MTAYHAEYALLGSEVVADVLIDVRDGRIEAVTERGPERGASRLSGLVIPGLVNAHSHAFHRALRGRTQHGGDFWAWRDLMYGVASSLDPDGYHTLARLVYTEMALAGITTVGEFHYLHHPHQGRYADPNEMGLALTAAAGDAGVRLTLIDTCYLHAGFGRPAEGVQVRFSDGSAEAWQERVDGLSPSNRVRVAAGIHSVRAVDARSAAAVATWAAGRALPLHFHLSEQPAENEECLEATGSTPAALLASVGAIGGASTAVHATHVSAADVATLGSAGCHVCVCPTTERDLGDGIGPVPELLGAGCHLTLGSDSNAVVDILEEARLVELHERLRSGRTGSIDPWRLVAAATATGADSLGWDVGVIAAGRPADLVAIDLTSMRTAGIGDPAMAMLWSAGAPDVTDVIVAGRPIVSARRHGTIEEVGRELDAVIRRLLDG